MTQLKHKNDFKQTKENAPYLKSLLLNQNFYA